MLLTGYSIWLGIVARAGLGVVMGAFSAIVPLYIIELSPPAATGFFGSFPQLLTSSGVTLVYLVGGWADWDVNAVVGACICGLLCLLVWIVPESPAVLSPTSLREAPPAESVCQSRYISSLVISCALMFFQQFTGVSGIVSNLDQIFKKAKVPESIQRYASAISGFAQVVGCLIAGSLIQTFGRKINWIISLAGIAITDFIYALYQNSNLGDKFPKWVPILVIFINMLGFGIGAGPIPWFVIPEMFPPDVRPAANSIGFCSNWVFTFTVIVTFPSLSKATGDWGVFLLFAIISFVGVVFGFFCVKDPVIGHMLEDSLGTAIYDGGDTE
jgi:MFS family permease